jgi:hypothetical protein
MNEFNFWVDGRKNYLSGYRWFQGDTLNVIGRGMIAGLVTSPLPTASFSVTSGNNPIDSDILISAKPFTLEYIPTLNVLEMSLLLDSNDTLNIELDQILGHLLKLSPDHPDYYKPAKLLYWETQVIQATPRLTRTYQGTFIIETDFNKDNLTPTPSPSPAPAPTPTP